MRDYASRFQLRVMRDAYANATKAERLEYARYCAIRRLDGKRPKIFYDWQRDQCLRDRCEETA